MLHHGVAIGVLAAFDRAGEGGEFSAAEEQLLRTFAASAANAVTLNRSVEATRLRSAIAAADTERGRWARELHDQTLQSLGGLRVLLSSAVRRGDPAGSERAMRQAIEDIEQEIENLRGIITDLRPSLLDDLGLGPAIESLVDRRRQEGLGIETELTLPASGANGTPIPADLETAIYRLVQETLSNVAKHAHANVARVLVDSGMDCVVVEVEDDGIGFDTTAHTEGFGLAGIRERVFLAGGRLHVQSGAQGTRIRAELPLAPDAGSVRDQVTS
jgi:signal transduction histidine kinase